MAQHNHYGHRQRLKDRFLQTGFTGFDAHGILELLLFYSIPQRDTNDLAHELVNRFGSLSGVFDASYERCSVKVKRDQRQYGNVAQNDPAAGERVSQ